MRLTGLGFCDSSAFLLLLLLRCNHSPALLLYCARQINTVKLLGGSVYVERQRSAAARAIHYFRIQDSLHGSWLHGTTYHSLS